MGICGRTGYAPFVSAPFRRLTPGPGRSGKSTAILAILSGVHPSLLGGRVLIDGVDLSTVPLATLRSRIR